VDAFDAKATQELQRLAYRRSKSTGPLTAASVRRAVAFVWDGAGDNGRVMTVTRNRVGIRTLAFVPSWMLAAVLAPLAGADEGYRVVRKTIELWRELHRTAPPSARTLDHPNSD
jgi:hypothetical protein